jgi:glycosyltransferase involved in cell wall biosynthesis
MRVSVVVPTYERPQLLASCLEHLLRQDVDTSEFEILVVDDGSSRQASVANHAVTARAARLRPGLAIHYVYSSENLGPAAARNRGWRCARSPVIAFTDDDTRPAAGWLREGLAALSGLDAASGRILVPLPGDPTDYERDAAGLANADFVTANCFVRTQMLRAVGGFDERYRMAWREDSDLQFELMHRGARIGCATRAVVVHPIRPARWGVSIRQQKRVLFDALLYKKYPRDYRRVIRRQPPWHYYMAVLTLIAMMYAAWRGFAPGVVAAGIAWAVITAMFSWTRLRATQKSPGHVLEMIATSALIPPVSVFWRICGAWRYRVLFL